jgi:hypothetical protein
VVGGSNPLAPTNQVVRAAVRRGPYYLGFEGAQSRRQPGVVSLPPSVHTLGVLRCILGSMIQTQLHRLSFLAIFSLLLSGFVGSAGCGEAPWLSGQIVVEHDGKTQPVSGARVFLYPVEALPKGKPAPEDIGNLSGAAVTLDGGTFEFGELSSNVSYANFELLMNWRYRLSIEDTAYYLKDITFDLEPGNNFVEVRLMQKTADVEAGDGEGIGKDEQQGTTGAVRRN